MKLPRYDAYKPSGIEWIGEIPAHWEERRFGTLFFERKEKVSDKEYEPLSVTKYGIVPQLETAAKTNDGDNRKLVLKGDFVINSRSDRKGSSGLSQYTGSVSVINIVLIPLGFKEKYCHYLLKSNSFIEEFYKYGHGIVDDLWTTRFSDIKTSMLPYPPFKEQKAIADFLDRNTSLIDKTISIKEQLIERLKERRQILIHRAVTRGLDLNVPMKDSGVEWIGEIPAHWEIKRFRHLFTFGKGLPITKENLKDEGIACINYGEIHSKYPFEVNPDKHSLKCVDPLYLEANLKSFLKYGDFVFADTSEDIEGSGNFTYLNSNKPVFAGYHTIIARYRGEEEMNYRFLAYLFDSEAFRYQIRKSVKGVKVYSITNAILKNTIVWIPPKKEQDQIIQHIETQTQKIDNAVTLLRQEIERLKEYKASLIDSVVTGKVRVTSGLS
jgi:type I restriction enzyme S subunit